jgi:hypothetical protein
MIPSSRVKSYRHFGRREKNYALLRYYASSSDNSIQMFQNNQSLPSSRVKKSLEKGSIGCPKTSLRITTTCCVTAQYRAVLIYFMAEA